MNCVVQLKLYIDFPITSKHFTETIDKVMLAESEGMLQRIADAFDRICKRRKLKVNAGKSKMMVFEKAEEHALLILQSRIEWGKRLLMPALGGNRFYSLRSFSLRLYFLFRRHMTQAVAAPTLVQSMNQSIKPSEN